MRLCNPIAEKVKPIGALGVPFGAVGTALAQQHLRNVLVHFDVPTLARLEAFIHAKDGLFDDAGNTGPDSKKFLQNRMDQYVSWVSHLSIED